MATEEEKYEQRQKTQAEEQRRRAQKEVNEAIQKREDEKSNKNK